MPAESTAVPVRAAGLDIHEAGDGFIVYQADRDRVHYLNPTATLILEACSGELASAEIAGLLAKAFSLPEPPLDDVERTLGELATEGLIVWREREGAAGAADAVAHFPSS